MDTGLLLGLAALLVVLLCALLAAAVHSRRSSRRALAATRLDLDLLRARVEQLEQQALPAADAAPPGERGYLITDAGNGGAAVATPAGGEHETRVGDRAVVSATLGEPLVKAVAFGYAVRRALSAPSRNRIAFEMRREVRRSRKERRRVAKRALREERSGQGAALVGGDPA
jgi:HAMP domain-containing protein